MRVKLDENPPIQLKRLFTESGHDVATVVDEGLGGASDVEVATVCVGEQRVLVMQDLDFSDIRTYPPAERNCLEVATIAASATSGFGRTARVRSCSRQHVRLYQR